MPEELTPRHLVASCACELREKVRNSITNERIDFIGLA